MNTEPYTKFTSVKYEHPIMDCKVFILLLCPEGEIYQMIALYDPDLKAVAEVAHYCNGFCIDDATMDLIRFKNVVITHWRYYG